MHIIQLIYAAILGTFYNIKTSKSLCNMNGTRYEDGCRFIPKSSSTPSGSGSLMYATHIDSVKYTTLKLLRNQYCFSFNQDHRILYRWCFNGKIAQRGCANATKFTMQREKRLGGVNLSPWIYAHTDSTYSRLFGIAKITEALRLVLQALTQHPLFDFCRRKRPQK